MKVIAFIFLCLISFFTVEPLIASRGLFGDGSMMGTMVSVKRMDPKMRGMSGMNCCRKKMQCPKKSTPPNNKTDCEGRGCNPFMSCAYGNFYLIEKGGLDFIALFLRKGKNILVNDNRLSTSLSDSWHPPEPFPDHTS